MKKLTLVLLTLILGVGVLAAQERVVTGVVTDATNGEPLLQAGVVVKGTQLGTVTDGAGRYTLRVPKDSVLLLFFYTGYESKEVAYAGQGEVNVSLASSHEEIEQVVVTGYQEIEKQRATGSYAILGQQEISRVATKSLASRLDEVAAGVTYNSETMALQVRGVTSLQANSAPLLVLDGLPFEGTLNQISPSTVQSVTVLRDAAAASIYGARASNGVIVIETKKGDGTFHASYDGLVQVKPIASLAGLNLMSSGEYVDYLDWLYSTYGKGKLVIRQGFYSDDIVRRWVQRYEQGSITDAEYRATLDSLRGLDNRRQVRNLLERTGVYHSHNLSVSGGDKYKFVGTARFEQELPNDKRTQSQNFSMHLRNLSTFNRYISMDVGLRAELGNEKQYTGIGNASNFYSSTSPYRMLYGADGEPLQHYLFRDEWSINNLVANGLLEERYFPALELRRVYRQDATRWGRSNLALTITPLDVLRIVASGAMEYGWGRNQLINTEDSYEMIKNYNDASGLNPADGHQFPRGGRLRQSLSETFSYTLRLHANYDQQFGVHRITALAGAEVRDRIDKLSNTELLGYDPQSLAFSPINEGLLSDGVENTWKLNGEPFYYELEKGEGESEERFFSFYASASYSLLQRYNITGSIRVDQSNMWGTAREVQWKPFWSIGVSWQMEEESFMSGARGWLDRLILRSSYGISGNVPRGAFPVLVVEPSISPWISSIPSFEIKGAPNPRLRWERTGTANVGVEWSMFGGSFSGSLEWYHRMTTDLLGNRPSDPTLGWNTVLVNYGRMVNRGVELSLYGQLLPKGDFRLGASFVFSYNRSKLLEVRGTSDNEVTRVMKPVNVEGYPYASLFSYRFAGLSPVDGTPQVYLHDGTRSRVAEEIKDLTFSGTVIPLYTSTLGLTFGWRGLELNASLRYYGGHVMRRPVSVYNYWGAGAVGMDRDYLRVWKQPGDEQREGVVPAPNAQGVGQKEQYTWSAADKHVLRADYIKLSALSLSYSLPAQWLAPTKIASLQVAFQVENIVNIPFNKAGVDPEMVGSGTAGGYRLRKLPPYYTVLLKLNI